MTSSSTASLRKWPPVFLCASRYCLSSKLQSSSLCLVAFSSPCTSGSASGRARGPAARGMSGSTGFRVVSTTSRRFFFGPAALGDSSYASRVHNSICSDQMFVCEVALAQPDGGFPPVGQLRCGIPRSLSHLWKMSTTRFTTPQHLSTITDHPWHDRAGTPEPKNEHCWQHCAHLSLQLFLCVDEIIWKNVRS